MVWNLLFGESRKAKQERMRREQRERGQKLRRELDPVLRNVLDLLQDIPIDPHIRAEYSGLLWNGELAAARKYIAAVVFPSAPDEYGQIIKNICEQGFWMDPNRLVDSGYILPRGEEVEDALVLGGLTDGLPDSRAVSVCFRGEGHLLTVAPTRSGKGQRYIIPNLLNYMGPAIILDPKGENYQNTAWRRDMFGSLFTFDPFGKCGRSDCFNPLAEIKSWSDAAVLSDLLVEPMSRDRFWDEAGKELLTGIIFHVRTLPEREKRNMAEVVRLLHMGKDDLTLFGEKLQKSTYERLRLLGRRIETEPETLFQSINTTLRVQLSVWLNDEIAQITAESSDGWDMETLWFNDRHAFNSAPYNGVPPGPVIAGGERHHGEAASLYFIIPPEKINTYRSVLRVLVGQHINGLIETHGRHLAELRNDPTMPDDAEERMFKSPRWPWLFVLDELPQLGYMEEIERAISIVGGVDIRLWLITQDIAQLSEVYPKWESILANCKGQVYFQPNDQKTANMISTRLGTAKNLWGEETPLAKPQDLMGPKFSDKAIIVFAGEYPIKADLPPYAYKNEALRRSLEEEKALWGQTIPRREQEPYERYYPFDLAPSNPEGEEVAAATEISERTNDDNETALDVPVKALERAIESSKENPGLPLPPSFKE
ncbi:type IV secretory system conjugative DNA transfer family protein [Sneathiella aquimaris]|uniref:type IV secretory system conjugative DNA transfer family protein n=1 Tax=Sneathiella aquimaris TaxID=2599305 RepID=UPI00146C34A7|nr:type IV secretory system conjugative DNA transfer family protein [Sneathiella aquimaris]